MDVPEDLTNDAATALSAVDQAPIMLLGLEGEELRWVLTNGSLLIVPPGRAGARPIADRLACVRAGSRSAVWAPQGGDGQKQVPRTQHVSGCRECGAGSVLGTPVATTGRATKKEDHHDDSADGQRRHCRRRP